MRGWTLRRGRFPVVRSRRELRVWWRQAVERESPPRPRERLPLERLGQMKSRTRSGECSPEKRRAARLTAGVQVHEGRNALPNIIRPIRKGQDEQNAEACFFNQQVLEKHSRKNSMNSPGSLGGSRIFPRRGLETAPTEEALVQAQLECSSGKSSNRQAAAQAAY